MKKALAPTSDSARRAANRFFHFCLFPFARSLRSRQALCLLILLFVFADGSIQDENRDLRFVEHVPRAGEALYPGTPSATDRTLLENALGRGHLVEAE